MHFLKSYSIYYGVCLAPKTTLISLSHENDDGYMEDATEMMLPQFLKVLDDDSNWQGGEEE